MADIVECVGSRQSVKVYRLEESTKSLAFIKPSILVCENNETKKSFTTLINQSTVTVDIKEVDAVKEECMESLVPVKLSQQEDSTKIPDQVKAVEMFTQNCLVEEAPEPIKSADMVEVKCVENNCSVKLSELKNARKKSDLVKSETFTTIAVSQPAVVLHDIKNTVDSVKLSRFELSELGKKINAVPEKSLKRPHMVIISQIEGLTKASKIIRPVDVVKITKSRKTPSTMAVNRLVTELKDIKIDAINPVDSVGESQFENSRTSSEIGKTFKMVAENSLETSYLIPVSHPEDLTKTTELIKTADVAEKIVSSKKSCNIAVCQPAVVLNDIKNTLIKPVKLHVSRLENSNITSKSGKTAEVLADKSLESPHLVTVPQLEGSTKTTDTIENKCLESRLPVKVSKLKDSTKTADTVENKCLESRHPVKSTKTSGFAEPLPPVNVVPKNDEVLVKTSTIEIEKAADGNISKPADVNISKPVPIVSLIENYAKTSKTVATVGMVKRKVSKNSKIAIRKPVLLLNNITDAIGCLTTVKVSKMSNGTTVLSTCRCRECRHKRQLRSNKIHPNLKTYFEFTEQSTVRIWSMKNFLQKKSSMISFSLSQDETLKEELWHLSEESDFDRCLALDDKLLNDSSGNDEPIKIGGKVPKRICSFSTKSSHKSMKLSDKGLKTNSSEDRASKKRKFAVTFENDKCNQLLSHNHTKDEPERKKLTNRKIEFKSKQPTEVLKKLDISVSTVDVRKVQMQNNRKIVIKSLHSDTVKRSSVSESGSVPANGDLRDILNHQIPKTNCKLQKVEKRVEAACVKPKTEDNWMDNLNGDLKSRLGKKVCKRNDHLIVPKKTESVKVEKAENYTKVDPKISIEKEIFNQSELHYWNTINSDDDNTEDEDESNDWPPYLPLITNAYKNLPKPTTARHAIILTPLELDELADIKDFENMSGERTMMSDWGPNSYPDIRVNYSRQMYRFIKSGHLGSNTLALSSSSDCMNVDSHMLISDVFSKKMAALHKYFNNVERKLELQEENTENMRMSTGDELKTENENGCDSNNYHCKLDDLKRQRNYGVQRLVSAESEIIEFHSKVRVLSRGERCHSDNNFYLSEREVLDLKDTDRMFHMFKKFYMKK